MAKFSPQRTWILSTALCVLVQVAPAGAQAARQVAQPVSSTPSDQDAQVETPLPCVTNVATIETSLSAVFQRLRSSQVTSLPGPAGAAIRARKAAEIARGHLDVDHFAQEVFRGLWQELDDVRRGAWKRTLLSLLQHRYVERIRDPRRHRLEILSTEVDCHRAKSRVTLHREGRKSSNSLEFHLRLSRQEGWRVYDVVLEGASLVNSWRSRLSRVHREEGHAGLDDQLHRLMRRYSVAP